MAKNLDQQFLWAIARDKAVPTEPDMPSPADPPLVPLSRMERARLLALDPAYPSEEIIKTLAEMLARHWYS